MALVAIFNSFTAFDWGAIAVLSALLASWMTSIHKDVKAGKSDIKEIKGDIKEITEKLNKIDGTVNKTLGYLRGKDGKEGGAFETSSPIRLTEYGKNLLKKSDGSKIVRTYKDKIDLEAELNEYEIQEKCINFALLKLEAALKPQELDKVQKTAFDAGLPIQTVLHVIGIALRDAIFADRGLIAERVDHHNPHIESQE